MFILTKSLINTFKNFKNGLLVNFFRAENHQFHNVFRLKL